MREVVQDGSTYLMPEFYVAFLYTYAYNQLYIYLINFQSLSFATTLATMKTFA